MATVNLSVEVGGANSRSPSLWGKVRIKVQRTVGT